MSTSAASPVAPAPASPPRGTTRPPHPRPTTYSGISPSVPASASASASASSSAGPPIPPPPRTSSKPQAPPANSASSSSDTRVNSRGGTATASGSGNGNGNGNGNSAAAGSAGDAQQDRSERGRDRRKPDAGSSRQDHHQPVGRSNSARAAASSSSRTGNSNALPPPHHHLHHQQQQQSSTAATDGRTSSRRRQDSESGPGRGRAGGADSANAAHQQHHHHAAANNGAGEPSSARRTTTRKETRFGEYILGQTLGEGEFGKVKLGWRRDGGVQVAIKLIRRDSVSPHPNRLSKIYREIAILRTLSHPNIVRLHEMVETDRHIGIILEYASGGELFDYILTHRYLKDPPACRLFAQLVSGVGYLHKKGIVHRDLKLENLLLDRNRNIIITDFGFANVFDPIDELGDLEDRLEDPAISRELEKGVPHTDRQPDGSSLLSIIGPGQSRRRGDLMATSCGSPCYAAPELVVSDGLYTGRKVDVWSCGVILYAMLAGYLPFDDDPANPEGDNINLLYKYIVSTPLTFPEYVTPHARDLLRRILVPDPRRRADLFEVARHSWLSPFADIVNKVTSATTGIKDVETVTITEPKQEAPVLNRSHSVREPSSTSHHHSPGALGPRHHAHETIPPTQSKPSSDNKRRTVQVEYVEPQSQTKRGSAVDSDNTSPADRRRDDDDAAPPPVVATHKDGSLTRAATTAGTSRTYNSKYTDKQKARDVPKDDPKLPGPEKGKTRPASYQYQQSAPASRAGASTDGPASGPTSGPPSRRPSRDRGGGPVSGKQPALASADTGARPTTANSLGSSRLPPSRGGAGASASGGGSGGSYSRPAAPSVAASNAQGRIAMPKASSSGKAYQMSSPVPPPATEGSPAGFSAGARPATQPDQQPAKGHKRANTVSGGGVSGDSGGFLGKIMGTSGGTTDLSSRPPILGGGGGGSASSSNPRQSLDQGRSKPDKPSPGPAKGRRFSLLPTSFSLRGISGGGESKHERKISRSGSRQYGQPQVQSQPQLGLANDGMGALSGSETSLAAGSAPASARGEAVPQPPPPPPPPTKRTTLSKHKKFGDAYEGEVSSGGHGSSGPARRVMDFFRRRGAARSKGEKS